MFAPTKKPRQSVPVVVIMSCAAAVPAIAVNARTAADRIDSSFICCAPNWTNTIHTPTLTNRETYRKLYLTVCSVAYLSAKILFKFSDWGAFICEECQRRGPHRDRGPRRDAPPGACKPVSATPSACSGGLSIQAVPGQTSTRPNQYPAKPDVRRRKLRKARSLCRFSGRACTRVHVRSPSRTALMPNRTPD
jgi:hypothetical protein